MSDKYAGALGGLRADISTEHIESSANHAAGVQPPVPGQRGCAVRAGLARMDGVVSASGRTDQNQGAISGGRQRSPGAGRPDGLPFGSAGGGEFGVGPRFDALVPPGGYLWWYADGLSDCGQYGFSVISFVGSVFSPYYKWKGRADPDDHCCINVAIYGPGENLWTMTERGKDQVTRDASSFTVGPSNLTWENGELTIRFDEVAVPKPPAQFLPKRIKGTIKVRPRAITSQPFEIDGEGKHKWWPIGPTGSASIEFDDPARPNWKGHGYLDCNWGTDGLEEDFDRWDWARGDLADGGAVLLYDTQRKDGSTGFLSLRFDADGNVSHVDAPPRTKLKRAFWGVPRYSHADSGFAPKLMKTLEDGPFYCRSVIDTQLLGERVELMHESFDGKRFRSNIVKAMLCFRMPRPTN